MDSSSRIAVIRNVLNQYPFSIGIFREIIQNSEDAKASKQIFLLDCRTHPPANLSGKPLAHTNGPALLAFNNATFRPEDWKGILATYGSSKRMDASKIGKNGMGFRACFHITNYPQVFSKDAMVMLDPQGDFFDEGETRVLLKDIPVEIQESLNLEWFLPTQGQNHHSGTIIRLPLRNEHHRREISTKTISCQEVEVHFQSFVQAEIDICLLFLSSLRSVEFWVIREGDTTPSRIVLSSITGPSDISPDSTLHRQVETIPYLGASQGKDWLVRWYSVPDPESQSQLSARIGCDARSTMEKEKLTATVALAIQTGVFPLGPSTLGKLFTYLPLPSDTNYPCNIHAPFALTVDRQALRNENEEGFVKGTDDHIRVEWNRYLFTTVIPVAWAKLLLDLSQLDPSPFSAWPFTHGAPSGCSYWQYVPGGTLGWIMENNIPVWPVQGSSTPPTYRPYQEVLIASPNLTIALLDAFASIGLSITQPPQDVYDYLLKVSQCHRILTPELASATILKLNPPVIDRGKRYHLLDYLLSTGRVENIIGVPLIEQADGLVIALSQRTGTSPNHVIFGEQDHEVFCQFAPHAISTVEINLPSAIAQLLQSTTLLNVEPLAAHHIITYIACAPSHFGPFSGVFSTPFTQYVSWISKFFEWLQCSPLENTLHSHLPKYPLLPIHNGKLEPISSDIFSTNYTHAGNELMRLLQRVGLPFLHSGISPVAQKYLDHNLKSLDNPCHVFTSLTPLLLPLSDSEIHTLQDYTLSHRWTIQKDQNILAILKNLPIYNHMVPSNSPLPQSNNFAANYLTEWSSIPNSDIVIVAPDVNILPMVQNTFFVPQSQLSLVQVFDQTLGITSSTDILLLAIHHFQSQPQDLQARFLELMSTTHIPSTSLSQLKSIPFILCSDGKLHTLGTLVDPTDRLAKLLPPHSSHLPRYHTTLQKRILDNLKSLSLLPNTLTMEIFEEVVDIIIQKQDTQLSNLLLEFLNDNSTSWSLPTLLLNSPWLDTTAGLSSPATSRDHKFAELCNLVLPLLRRGKRIQSQKLLHALHWNIPPSLQTVVAQFKALVKANEKNPHCVDLFPVTSFLGLHLEELSRSDYLQELEQFVKGKSWVPTYGPSLTSTTFAIFKQDQLIYHFKQIISQFADDRDARSFLQAMGCKEKPSQDAISLVLQDVGNVPAAEVVAFLRAIHDKELKAVLESGGAHLSIIPTSDGTLGTHPMTYFNDLGPHAEEVPLPPGYSIASDHVDRNLALKLGLSFLSDLVGTLEGEEPMEMKEDLTTRISSVLLSYTKEQAFMEFLANAADARATEFGITLVPILPYQLPENQQFYSPTLKKLCSQPFLLLHNNGTFLPSDWKGICNVGSGNKQESIDGKPRIGRFGLGSLSMFYFTEVAMILSGRYVLFMDPRKAYLGRDLSCKKVPLEDMKKFWPGHLSLLDGHYGYKASMDEYNGTLFKLHLRTGHQATQSTIYKRSFSEDEIKRLINDFKRRAQDALFFIPIEKIKVSYPSTQPRHQPESWAVEKLTKVLPGFSGVMKINNTIHGSRHWSVLFEAVPLQAIPSEFHKCLSIHKIQTVSVGIAGAIDTPTLDYRLFFGVPLLGTISLPVHLHCTFILSDDRRSIRYDEEGDGNLESRFNKWLLTKKVPSLYLQFLSGWKPTCSMKDCPWWPKRSMTDGFSRVVVEAMHDILPTSDKLVCDTYSGPRTAPSKAHFLQPSCPKGLLLALLPLPEDLAAIPPGFSTLTSPSLQKVDSEYLTAVLQRNAASIMSMYKEGRITVDDVVDVAKFLKPSSLADFHGLPLLPLADRSLTLLSAEHTTFYYPEHDSLQFPFPLHHFLDPHAAKERLIYDTLQVRELDNTAVSQLIMAKIPKQDIFLSSPDLEKWFKELWDLLSAIPAVTIEDRAFERLPLIPTYNPGTPTRISFQKLSGSEALLVEPNVDVPLDECVALGMKLIKTSNCRRKLKEVVRSRKGEQSLGVHRVIIKFFMDLPLNDIPDRFQELDHGPRSKFSRWFRAKLSHDYRSLSGIEKAIVGRLPLWEVIQTTPRFVSANDAVVIPKRIGPDVVRMWATGSTTYTRPDDLLTLMKEPLTLTAFYDYHLTFPSIMNTITPTYKALLTEVLRSPLPQRSILVPNANGRMTQSNSLYLSSNTTFAAAFASDNRRFLHRELRDLEQQLCNWGLIGTLNASSFSACASAIHEHIHSAGTLTRAITVFRSYNTEMPPELMRNRGSRNTLQHLRFIPRRVGDTRYGSIPTDRYHSPPLPNIVSPREIVDPKFIRIAWTQRATCIVEPSSELLLVNGLDSVWKPNAREVSEHLRILATEIAPGLGYNSELVEDLKATYSWLAGHEDESKEWLLDHNQVKLFLNVDNPGWEWKWSSASELLFDEKDSSNPRRVRQFLKDYGGLLRAAGVQTVTHVSVPVDLQGEVTHEEQLKDLRDRFNEMREAGKLTDVTLVAEDDTEFKAHRVFLAARSEHFRTKFTKGWRESVDLEGGDELVGHSKECLKAVLDWIYTGQYDLQVEETKRLGVLGEIYKLAHYWGLEDSDLFKGLTRKLIESISTQTYEDLRRLAEDLNLGDGQLAKKCEEFERMNRAVLAENR